MTIRGDQGWADLEQKAQDAERREAESYLPVLPVPSPTIEQQLVFLTTRCAELENRIFLMRYQAAQAVMWLTVGQPDRAQETMNKIILDL